MANFLHKLWLTNRKTSNLCTCFANNSSANIKLSKTQLSQIIQSGEFLGKPLGSIIKVGLPLKKGTYFNQKLKLFWYYQD